MYIGAIGGSLMTGPTGIPGTYADGPWEGAVRATQSWTRQRGRNHRGLP